MNKLQKIRDYQKLHGTIQTFSWLCNNVKFRLEKLKSKPIEFDYITLTEEDDKNYVPKTKNNIFIFALTTSPTKSLTVALPISNTA